MNFFNECKALTFENDLHLQISVFETIRLFKFLFSFPLILMLNVLNTFVQYFLWDWKSTEILILQIQFFIEDVGSRKKKKRKMYAYHRIDLFRNKAPYEKNIYIYNFNVDISI